MKVVFTTVPPEERQESNGFWQNHGLVEQPKHTLLVLKIKSIPKLMARIRRWILEGK